MKNLKIDNHKNYNLVCVQDYKEIHLIQVDNIYIDRYCGSMSVIGERLWVWSTKELCNLVRGVGECTRQSLHDVKYFWTNWDEFKEMSISEVYSLLGEYWEY